MNEILPIGTSNLPLTTLDPSQFEKFCTLLLQKDTNFEDVHRITGKGHRQYGIDICGKHRNHAFELVVFECKCWQSIDTDKIKETLDKFINKNSLKKDVKTYILMVAQDSLTLKAEELWRFYQKKLEEEFKIKSELWTGDHLTKKAQAHPEIINKFFPKAISEMFECKWMAKVNFIDTWNKALLHSDPKLRNLAENLLDNLFISHKNLESEYIF